MTLVLYRKYRPQKFSDVIGQEESVRTLTNSITSGILSHAYLFSGPRGSGKTTLARLLAKALNCQNRHGYEPCNKCSSCLEIMNGSSMDVVEIDAASHRGIDEIRELREAARFAPSKSTYKIYIIDESHQLTKDANNALLKILEEAPDKTIFILATTEANKMIPTVISRCQRYDFRRLRISEIVKKLEMISKKEGIDVEKDALTLIASQADGAARDAEGLLGQVISFAGGEKITREKAEKILGLTVISSVRLLANLILKKEAGEAIQMLNNLAEKGADLQELSKSLTGYLRQILVLKIAGEKKARKISSLMDGVTDDDWQIMVDQADDCSEREIKRATEIFLSAESKMKYSSLPQLPLELAIVEVAEED